MIAFVITWCKKPYVRPYLLDVSSAELAAEVGLRLAASPGVYDVKVTEISYEEDAEMRDRGWARVNARMREYRMIDYALQEASK